jgi:hypothetical protein
MIEIITIIIQFFTLHLFFSTPFNLVNYKKLNLKFSLNYFDIIFCNIILHIFILLIISFLNINLLGYFLIILFISLITNISLVLKNLTTALNIYKILFPIICLSIFFEISYNAKLEWDGLAHWFWKVNNFYQNQDISNVKNLPLSQYPHLGSFVWSFFWKNSISNYEYIGRLFIPYIYIVSLFAICSDIKNKLFGLLFILIIISSSYDIFLFGGYQEYITFAYICFLTKLIFIYKNNYNDKLFSYALILIGSISLLWVKQECLFYVIFFNLCFINYISKRSEKIVYFLILFFSVILSILIEKNIKGTVQFQTQFNFLNLEKFKELNLLYIYIIEITKHIIISFLKYPILILNLLIFLFYLRIKKQSKKEFQFILFFFLLNFIFLYAIYFLHPAPLAEMLPNTLDRLIFQISSVGIVFMCKWTNEIRS